jgi:hypothetical protein
MVAPFLSSVAPGLSFVATILPFGGVSFAATISAAVAIPSSGNESLSFDVHFSVATINNTSAIAFPHVYSTAMVPSFDFTAVARPSHTIVPLSNTQQVISLKLSNTNFLYWRMQMKPYLLGQGVYFYVDGSFLCPPAYISSAGMPLFNLNPSYLSWKQQDQLIISVILSSISTEVLHIVVDCQTSHSLWTTLETTLTSPSNLLIMQWLLLRLEAE